MGYFSNKGTFFGTSVVLKHRAKYGTANSTTSEKGTDGKKNNSSEYNHKYYEENKEKWDDNKKKGGTVKRGHYDPEGDDEDFKKVYGDDLKNPKLNMDTHIKGTDFYKTKNKDGQIVLINGNKKWTLPKGVELTAGMIQQLGSIDSKQGKQGEEFDKAMSEFMKRNKYDTEDEPKKSKSTSSKSSSTKESSESSSKSTSSSSSSTKSKWDEIVDKYTGKEEKADPKKAAETAQSKGKSQTEYYKKQQEKKKTTKKTTKQTSQFVKHSDIGSVLVKDLL